MTTITLGIPLAAALSIILLSVGLKPARVVAVWAALSVCVALGGAFLESDGAPAAAPAQAAQVDDAVDEEPARVPHRPARAKRAARG